MSSGNNVQKTVMNRIRRLELRHLYFSEVKTQQECAEILGVSQPAICKALKRIETDLMKEAIGDKKASLRKRLVELRSLYVRAVKGYESSRLLNEEFKPDPNQPGNPAFLQRALAINQEISKLLGLYPTAEIDLGDLGTIQPVAFILHPVDPEVAKGDNH